MKIIKWALSLFTKKPKKTGYNLSEDERLFVEMIKSGKIDYSKLDMDYGMEGINAEKVSTK